MPEAASSASVVIAPIVTVPFSLIPLSPARASISVRPARG